MIAIENHSHSLLQTPEGIRRFAEIAKHERVGIALAPHHLPQDAELIASLAHDLGPQLKFVYAQQHGKGAKEKLPKEDELLQMPGRGPFDFGPLMRALADMRFGGPIEIFMRPVPRGVPILDSVQAITAEVNRAGLPEADDRLMPPRGRGVAPTPPEFRAIRPGIPAVPPALEADYNEGGSTVQFRCAVSNSLDAVLPLVGRAS